MNLLLTSAGRRSYMVIYFREALAGEGLVHAANSIYSPALQAADRAVITPPIYSSEYIDFLIAYCRKNAISAIVSLFDIDLPVLSGAKGIFFKEGIKVIVSNNEVVRICNDKWETYSFLNNNGFKTPKTYKSIADVSIALNERAIHFPLIIKPRWGMGSIGIYITNSLIELAILYKKTKDDILGTCLRFESKETMDESVLVQEKISGQEYGLDVVNSFNRDYVTTFVKKKIAMRSGETDSAVTEFNPALLSLGQQLANCLGHIGNLDVDVFMVDGQPFVLEMNCRFGGGYPFSHLAGANLPLAYIKWLKQEVPDRRLFEIQYGITGMKDIQLLKCKNTIE